MKKAVFIHLLILLVACAVAEAQTNFLLVEQGVGSAGQPADVPVEIRLLNDRPLSGLQFVLDFDSTLLISGPVIATARLSGMQVYYQQPHSGRLSVVVVSTQSNHITEGDGSILILGLRVRNGAASQAVALQLSGVIFSDTTGQALSAGLASGYFIIRGHTYLVCGNGAESMAADSIAFRLVNETAAGAAQLTISYDSSVLQVDSLWPAPRSQPLLFQSHQVQPGKISAVFFSLGADSIPAGYGPLFFAAVSVIPGSIYFQQQAVQSLNLENVVVSSTGGTALPVTAVPGTFLARYVPPVSLNEEETVAPPDGFELKQNYPNPFNPTTRIGFVLYRPAARTILDVFDVGGKNVATLIDENLQAGAHSIIFDGRGLPSGTYFYRLRAAGESRIRKMLLVK